MENILNDSQFVKYQGCQQPAIWEFLCIREKLQYQWGSQCITFYKTTLKGQNLHQIAFHSKKQMLFWSSRNESMLLHFFGCYFSLPTPHSYVKRKASFIFPNLVTKLLFLTFFLLGLHNCVFIHINWCLLFQSLVIKKWSPIIALDYF